jgi:hypothetical protein
MLHVREGEVEGHVVGSWDELMLAFPDQWVVVLDVDFLTQRNLEFRSARVVGCGPERDDALTEARHEIERDPTYCCWHTTPVEIISFRLLGL